MCVSVCACVHACVSVYLCVYVCGSVLYVYMYEGACVSQDTVHLPRSNILYLTLL